MPFRLKASNCWTAQTRQACFFKMVSPSYFHTLKIKLRKGRGLAETDTAASRPPR